MRNFLGRSEALDHGIELLRGHDAGYPTTPEAKVRSSQTLIRAREALTSLQRPATEDLLLQFVRLLLFDAWIGNGDRHGTNWGVIRSPDSLRLAPVYDPAACLGVELLDRTITKILAQGSEAIRKYALRCPSGFGNGARLVKMPEVLAELMTWPLTGPECQRMIRVFEQLLETVVGPWLDPVPVEWLSEQRKDFVFKLLAFAWVS